MTDKIIDLSMNHLCYAPFSLCFQTALRVKPERSPLGREAWWAPLTQPSSLLLGQLWWASSLELQTYPSSLEVEVTLLLLQEEIV